MVDRATLGSNAPKRRELRAAAATGSSSTYVSPSESVRRKEIKTLQPVTVKRALVHATSVMTTRDGERVLSVDMRPLVIHLLAGLEQAGILHAVITLGHDAAHMAECVTAYGFTEMKIDFVYLTLGSAVGSVWRNLANSVVAARAAFEGDAPLLIVRADHLYDSRLLRKLAAAPFGPGGRFDAYALVDATPALLRWAAATKARNTWTRVALAERDRQRVIRCGSHLGAFDAVVAGECYAATPAIFGMLSGLFSQSLATALSDAMDELVDRGRLGVVECGELDRHWFESRTLSRIFQPGFVPAGSGSGGASPWAPLYKAARELLYSGEWRPTANMPTPPVRGELERCTAPLLQLGSTLGEGAHGVVVEAEPGSSAAQSATSRLAVKMIRASGGGSAAAGRGRHPLAAREGMEAVMWEVHVLRQLHGHENIVRLCDVVELADEFVCVVMERIEGPDLADYISAQPGGRLSELAARRCFRHILAALRHAHSRGIVHCDVKPANVRLQVALPHPAFKPYAPAPFGAPAATSRARGPPPAACQHVDAAVARDHVKHARHAAALASDLHLRMHARRVAAGT